MHHYERLYPPLPPYPPQLSYFRRTEIFRNWRRSNVVTLLLLTGTLFAILQLLHLFLFPSETTPLPENLSWRVVYRSQNLPPDTLAHLNFPLDSVNTRAEPISGSSYSSKTILVWTTFFYGDLAPFFHRMWPPSCQYSCQFLNHKHRFELINADAVIFHLFDMEPNALPKRLTPEQVFVMFSQESPEYFKSQLHHLNLPPDFFQAAMTYKRDATTYSANYGEFIRKKDHESNGLKSISKAEVSSAISRKTKLAVGMISNCGTSANRGTYIKEMMLHGELTIIGDCFGGGDPSPCKKKDSACENELFAPHHFILAFENAVCPDYVTEKFFWRISQLIVPVVFRRRTYSGIVPESSFIAADDFASAKELVAYMQKVAANHTLYERYFDWTREYYSEIPEPRDYLCDFCRDLHHGNVTARWPDNDLYKYFGADQCESDVGSKLKGSNSLLDLLFSRKSAQSSLLDSVPFY